MGLDLANEIIIRWIDLDPKYVPLLKEGGISVVWAPSDEAFHKACQAAGLKTISDAEIQTLSIKELDHAKPGLPVAVRTGLWPGVRGRNEVVASASRSLWVDANGFRVGYIRALYPGLTPLLGYLPDKDAGVSTERAIPFGTLELALTEAWVGGGNYVLALERGFREAILRGEPKAITAWRGLGQTARWLREHRALFRQRPLPLVTVLVDRGDISAEVANLMYRQNVSPALEPAENPPRPDPSRRPILVAAGIAAPSRNIGVRVTAHAAAGSTIVVDDPSEKAWWRRDGLKHMRSWQDRDLYSLGKGQVVAYKEPISDPGEFALDVIDIVTQKKRPVRLWNCQGGIAVATSAPSSGPFRGRALLHVVNYSSPVDLPVLARIQGSFSRATLLRPEAPALELRVAKRGASSEIALPRVGRVAVTLFR